MRLASLAGKDSPTGGFQMYKRFASYIAFVVLMVSACAYAQNDVESDRPWLKPPDLKRAWVYIKNDYTNTVKLTMWTKRGVQIGAAWALAPGQGGYLTESGQKITASPEYVLKVGDDPGEVEVQAVSERHGQTWNVSVRKVWMATHQRIDQVH